MVAKINVGSSLYGVLAYNGEKINEGQGRLLATHKIFDEGTGRLDIRRAAEDFSRCMPAQVRTRNTVIHISLNPHPDDRLTDTELTAVAEEYLEKLGYGNQPYVVFKHEDIGRHHLHIISVNVDEDGRRLNKDFLHRRSKRITDGLECKYGLHTVERKRQPQAELLCTVDTAAGDVKRQVGNVLKGISGRYKFQTLGEYRALLSLYNLTVEECRGEAHGREYRGFVYSATDDRGKKVGSPIKGSRFGKRYGYEAFERWCTASKEQIKERKLGNMTHATAMAALLRTKDRAEFIALLKAKGVDVVLRETDTGAYLWRYVHRPPHEVRAERLPFGQGAFCELLAGTLCTSGGRHTAPDCPLAAIGYGERTDASIPLRRRSGWRFGAVYRRHTGHGCRGGSLHARNAATKKEKEE